MTSALKKTPAPKEILPLDVGETFYVDTPLADYVSDESKMALLREQIDDGHIVIFKKFAAAEEIANLKRYLHGIQLGSLPNFYPITKNAHNNFRVNLDDERAQIRAFFYVWSFFPWNQDLFSLYERYKPVYHLRNRLCRLPADTFVGREPEYGCAARLSVQFYPAGRGYFTPHTDPYDVHQIAVPLMAMSKAGRDFKTGGNFVARLNGEKIYTEELTEPGDIVLVNARCMHGVGKIDPEASFDPLGDAGRWMMLFAVNKIAGNIAIADAVDQSKRMGGEYE